VQERRAAVEYNPPPMTPARPQEQHLIDLRADLKGERILCTTAGHAQLAVTLAAERPSAKVRLHFFDAFLEADARGNHVSLPPNLEISVGTDLPPGENDLVVIPASTAGDATFTRELLQEGHERLAIGGVLATSTDSLKDTWLAAQMAKLFDAVTRRPAQKRALAYLARKKAPLKRKIDFTERFAFRDGERLIQVVSRPGVFSHGRVDGGARALLESMHVARGERVVDIGCGSGVVALGAAFRAEGVHVHAVDAFTRAVACVEESAKLNALTNLTTELNAAGKYVGAGTYDLALMNPPYFSNFRIAELFVDAARDALKPGGRFLLVTKAPEWFRENLPERFEGIREREARSYVVFEGKKKRT
jgi:16S rRNA G1207 methylase RsmC